MKNSTKSLIWTFITLIQFANFVIIFNTTPAFSMKVIEAIYIIAPMIFTTCMSGRYAILADNDRIKVTI